MVVEPGRKDADDFPRIAVQRECLTQSRRIGVEVALPESMAQHHYVLFAQLFLFSSKVPPDKWVHSQQLEEAGGTALTYDPLWFTASCQVEVGTMERGHTFKNGILVPPFYKSRSRDAKSIQASLLRSVEHPNQSLRLAVRERLEQYAVDNAEHGGVCPDAECQGEHSNGREPAILSQHPHSVTDVLRQVFNPAYPPPVATSFFD